jgi:hypothetical protein
MRFHVIEDFMLKADRRQLVASVMCSLDQAWCGEADCRVEE